MTLRLSVLVGNGNGTFSAELSLATGAGSWPYAVTVGDVNGDAKPDLISTGGGGVNIFLGNGNATFQARQFFTATGGGEASSVALGDISGDGKIDIVSGDGSDLIILLGNGNGTFKAEQSFDDGGNPRRAILADVNSDCRLDVVSGDDTNNVLRVVFGNGNGTFYGSTTYGAGEARSVVSADFNRDGILDLASGDYGASNTVSVLLGNGTTTTTTTASGLQPITGLSLATQADALSAQGQIDSYLDTVNKVSGTIGTALSRFQIAAQTASSVADVSQAAEARITDADVADNSAALVRSRILQQAASAVLAQANQQPALALTLLRE